MESGREVKISAVNHNHERRILIQFPPDDQLDHLVRQLPGCQWSRTFEGWHVPNNPESLKLIFRTFKGIATIDKTGVFGTRSEAVVIKETKKPLKVPSASLPNLSEVASLKIDDFILWMNHLRYSKNTIKTYTDGIKTFLRFTRAKMWRRFQTKI
jgi:integrase/recombinase XerD